MATHKPIPLRLAVGLLLSGIATAMPTTLLKAQSPTDSTTMVDTLHKAVVRARQTTRRSPGAINSTSMLRSELFKAACCNLGESFVNNPSVDVNYSDAATGAKQIKLLGLAGKYVQMLTENLPDFRGAALPYGLGYIPGSWMKSIQVSKGNSSVKNGYEAVTGQINVEYLKPEDETGATINAYGNTMSRFEANAEGNIHVGGNKNLSTEILGHFENNWSHHDGNHDGFQDAPNIRQYNFQNRWYYKTGHYMFHGGVGLIDENRSTGQTTMHRQTAVSGEPLYHIGIDTHRYTAYMKHAYLFGDQHNTNIALMGNVSMHQQDADYGHRHYDVNEKNAYGSLMLETTLGEHALSAGLSLNHDYLHQGFSPVVQTNGVGQTSLTKAIESETTPGAYAQYTFNHHGKLIAMAGGRIDHSNVYGTFFTPRLHAKWIVNEILTLRASAGKGYRSPHALAENNNLMASSRQITLEKLKMERAWTYGAAANFYIPLLGQTLKLNTEYYYTRFSQQTVIDYDSNPHELLISNLHGKSYSHTFQADAEYTLFHGFDLMAAYRYNLVKTTYGGRLLWKPLQSRYKALLSASFRPDPGLWELNATFALNGGGRMPATTDNSRKTKFKAYPMLNMQVKRSFRHFDVYIGGENLTNYKQKHPIVGYDNPWGENFDSTLICGPITGAMGYVSVRVNIGNRL